MIEVQSLTKEFGPIRAVDNVSFTVKKGEVLGFLGPNGAGKSTTMKMIAGFLAPTSGRASVCGHDVENDPIAAKSCLGYLPEGAPLYVDMTPAGFLGFVADIRGFRGPDRKRRIDNAVQLAQLESVYNQPIDTLSKGFKRRVGLAHALLHDPEALVLDEPTDGLDPNQKHDVREIIREMAPEKTIIISTHILEEVDAICTRAIIIAAGRVVADGTPKELETRSRTHQAVLLKMRNVPAAAQQMLSGLPGVAAVEHVPGGLQILPKNDEIIYSTVEGFVRDRAWPVDDIVFARGHLEDIFREITRAPERHRLRQAEPAQSVGADA
ncbi:MAG: ABC transporter ATP-binding protein [Rhodospirillaceae bacterium]|nr:ABC transporter ATP-binding protein [Rhodospirillaceae bacterium]